MPAPVPDLEAIAKTLGSAGAIAASVWAVVRGGAWCARALWRKWRRAKGFFERLERAVAEILPNGGGSLSDAVRRVEAQVAEVRKDVAVQVRMAAVNANRWRALHQDDRNGIADFDEAGRLVWANRTFLLGMVGRELSEVLGNGWLLAISPELREDVWGDWTAALEQRRDFERQVQLERRDGSRVVARMRAACILDDHGDVAGMSAVVSPAA